MAPSTPNSTPDLIQVTMLGEFSVAVGENSIQDTTARTHQLWHLIEYLITFRHRPISQQELIDVLWPKGDIDNPANALKNLVYRVRSTLSANGLPQAREMIVYSRGGYHWNNKLPCRVDAEEFVRACQMTQGKTLSSRQLLDHYLAAIRLYRGDFLPGARFETWVVPIAEEYRAEYFRCVYGALALLQSQKRYEEMEEICETASQIDPFEEGVHRARILACIRQGKQTQALSHYSAVTDLFFRELGVGPSGLMRALYREIAKTTHDVQIDLDIIKEDLEESDRTPGAFYCEYEVFKNLYRLEARTAMRTGQTIFVSLVTLEDSKGSMLELKTQTKMMDSLYTIIQSSLRKGDVFARFSASQYVLMLPALTFENCSMVMERITRRFRGAHRGRDVSIYQKIQPLDPVDPEDYASPSLNC